MLAAIKLPVHLCAGRHYGYFVDELHYLACAEHLDWGREVLEKLFAEVRFAARVGHPYAMPYEHFDVFYCRGLKQPLQEFWPEVKRWE